MKVMQSDKPKVFIIGAPKCGTTSLASYLNEHPAIDVSNPKEPLYYCEDFPSVRKFKSEGHYLKAFPRRSSKKIDASIWYLYSAAALKRIKREYQNPKIIIGVREPTSFMYSLFVQHKFGGSEDCEKFIDAWAVRSERRRGRNLPIKCKEPVLIDYEELANYYNYVARWVDEIGKNNVFIYSLEEMKENPGSLYSEILKFIDVYDWQPDSFGVVNSAKGHKSKVVKWILHSWFFRSGWHQPFKAFLGISSFGVYERLRGANIKSVSRDEEDMSGYASLFSESNEKLFTLVGRELW